MAGSSFSSDLLRVPQLRGPLELLELAGVGPEQADAILRFREQHGPIRDVAQLGDILGSRAVSAALSEHADFSPSEATAPEAPGAEPMDGMPADESMTETRFRRDGRTDVKDRTDQTGRLSVRLSSGLLASSPRDGSRSNALQGR